MLRDASLLITGGTGSFGRAFIRRVLEQHPGVRQLIVFSRDEQKQYEMAQAYPRQRYPQLRYVLGDVRDASSLLRAMKGVDYVVHAAALKHVPIAEENPWECIRTNVVGAENIINAALEAGVKRVVALSTDKAAAPINLYGASKLCADKLFIAANNLALGPDPTRFVVVRYGNFMGSRGSVIPHFLELRKTGALPITHPEMTRFSISLERCTDTMLYALAHAWGGEIIVPKIPCFRITDLAAAIGPNCRQEVIGIRPGEKLHEDLITASDSLSTYEFAKHYVIGPTLPLWDTDKYLAHFKGERVPEGFSYHSNQPTAWLSVAELRTEIEQALNISLAAE